MKTIKVKKGRHYHSNWGQHVQHFFAKNKSSYKCRLNNDCWYPYLNEDSEDWNKLHGIKGWKKLWNEGIIAWKPDFDRPGHFRIAFYGRTNGRIWFKEIKTVPANVLFTSTVTVVNQGYQFELDAVQYIWSHPIPRGELSVQSYFGGNNKAPHTYNINYEKIKR